MPRTAAAGPVFPAGMVASVRGLQPSQGRVRLERVPSILLMDSFPVRFAPCVALSLRFCHNGAFSLRRCMLLRSVLNCPRLSSALQRSGDAESMVASSLPTTPFTKVIFGMEDRFGGLRVVRGNAPGALPTLMMTLQRRSFLHSPRTMMTLRRMAPRESSNKYIFRLRTEPNRTEPNRTG